MKPPILLKTILDICFFLLLLTFISASIISIITFSVGDDLYPIVVNDQVISELTLMAVLLIIAELLIGGLLVYTVYILRKLIRNFFKGKLFTRYEIASLNLIGRLIIVITLAQGLMDFLGKIFVESKLRLGIEIDLSFNSYWFVLAIGLFFIYLAGIFENARLLKEENELTV